MATRRGSRRTPASWSVRTKRRPPRFSSTSSPTARSAKSRAVSTRWRRRRRLNGSERQQRGGRRRREPKSTLREERVADDLGLLLEAVAPERLALLDRIAVAAERMAHQRQ